MTMLASVTVHEDGAVTATVDTADDDLNQLAGLLLDDMLDQASKTALATWYALNYDDEPSDDEPADVE